MNKKSALLTKYKYLYEKNPRSKVFAPLAETYRKLGMFKEGVQILRDGIKIHPSYTLGYIVLANIYFDEGHYELAYSTVRSFVSTNLENITLQRLFGKICLELNKFDEALETYKLMLLLNPKDDDVIEKVRTLEDKLNYSVVIEDKVEDTNDLFDDKDDWVQVDFNKDSVVEDKVESVDNWQQENSVKSKINFDEIEVKEHDLSSDYYFEDYDNESEDVITAQDDELDDQDETQDKKIISHKLIDLYYSQGHIEKAIDLLREALSQSPDDEQSLTKLEAFQRQLDEESSIDELVESASHSEILEEDNLKENLEHFLELIKSRAKSKQDESNYN